MRTGDDSMARGGAGEAHTDWVPPFVPDDDTDDRRGQHHAARPAVAWYVPFAGRLLTLLAIGMLLFALAGGLFGVTTTRSKPSTGAVPVTTSNPIVHITSAVGAIRVVPIPVGDRAKADAVTVEAITEVRHLSPFLAQRNLDGAQITPTVGDNGEVYIDTKPDGDGDFFFRRSTTATVYVPRGTALDLRVQFGAASVTGLSGPMTIEISGGVLNIVDTTLGDGSRIQLHGGNANLDDVTLNGRVDLTVNGGNIDLNGMLGTSTALNVLVNGGNADLRLPLATDAGLDAQADGGGLSVSNSWPGEIKKDTARSNSQHLTGFLSNNKTTTNRITLKLSGGGISLRPQTANAAPRPPATPPAP